MIREIGFKAVMHSESFKSKQYSSLFTVNGKGIICADRWSVNFDAIV
jgi:hypothetical protein